MSSSETSSPRSANTSAAAARMRRRLRSASARSGRPGVSATVIASQSSNESETVPPLRATVADELEERPPLPRPRSPPMSPQPQSPHHERRWLILAVIGVAQLMVILDATIVNIALPSAQQDLGFSDDQRQWIITAYALAFGSLLLLGGKLGDLFGRKWTFIGGLLGFSIASAIGGAAGSFGMLVGARALQGVFAA